MNCMEIQEKMIDLITGEISPEERMLIREHIENCSVCSEEYEFISHCVQCWSPAETERFSATYWEEFEISIHEKICQCKPVRIIPYRIIIPIAATILSAAGICYILFFRPIPKEIVKPVPPSQQYDPYHEVYELSPEEQQEFIKLINQKYPRE